MAFEALLRRAGEIGGSLHSRGGGRCSGCCRTMTSDASGILMGAFEWKFRRRVVEAAEFFPVPRVMAGFARLFSRVRIAVASRARLIGEVILAGRRRGSPRDMRRIRVVHVGHGLVAVGAHNG